MSTPSPLQFLAIWGLIFLTCIAFWAAVVIALPELGLVLLGAMVMQLVGPPGAESRDPRRRHPAHAQDRSGPAPN